MAIPWHTHGLILAFLLFWYFNRQYIASITHLLIAGALISGLFAGLRAALLPWLQSLHKAAMVTSLLCLFLLFFEDLRGALAECLRTLNFPNESRVRIALPLFAILFGAGIVWVARTRRSLARASQAMDLCSAVLAGMVLAQIFLFKPGPPASSRYPELNNLSGLPVSTNARRDIYLIVADSRTSSAALKRYWNYDDASFTSELHRLGFQCAPDSRSEYSSTLQCISTLMNMEKPEVPSDLRTKRMESYLARTIRDSRVPAFLARQGYEIINLSLFDLADQPRFYTYFDEGSYYSIFTATLPGNIWRNQLNRSYFREANERVFGELSRLPGQSSDRPRFVYAHLMMPHSPYYYDRHGQQRELDMAFSEEETPHAYLEQLIYADQLILQTVRTILSDSQTPPVILLRGDHGFRSLPAPDRDDESRATFFAAYLPGSNGECIPSNVTHAVVFRDVLNRYFGTGIPLESGSAN
jgi:hypothetical protein